MDKRLLFSAILAATVGANEAQAQKVSAPVLTADPVELNPETMTGEDTVYIYNVKAQKWLVNGNAYGTQTSLGDKGMKIALIPNKTKKVFNGTFSFYNDSNSPKAGTAWTRRMFFNAPDENGGNSYVDRNQQAEWKCNWVIIPKGKSFEIQADTISANESLWEADYANIAKNSRAGWNPKDPMLDGKGETATDQIFRPALNMSDANASEYGIEWQAYKESDYKAYSSRVLLMNAINAAIDDELDVSKAIAVYNNASATTDEIDAATQLVSDIRRNETMKNASDENPVDITEYLKDANCDALDGWTRVCEEYDADGNVGSGGHGTNWQNQSNSTYKSEDGEYTSSKFIERWVNSGSNPDTGDEAGTGHLSDAMIYQKLTNLPKGGYKVSCYAMATQQGKGDDYKVEGVSLFANTNGEESSAAVATKGGKPQKFEFYVEVKEGEDLTIGFKLDKTTANWVFVDQFELQYFGADAKGMYLANMQKEAQNAADILGSVGACYPDYIDAVNALVEEGLAMTTDESKETLIAQKTKIEDALKVVETSVAKYQELSKLNDEITQFGNEGGTYSDELTALIENCGNDDPLEDLITATYSLDNDALDAYMAKLNTAFDESRKNSIQPGSSITYKIVNPTFENGTTGWTGAQAVSSDFQNCEAYQKTFDMYQDLDNLPNGVYEVSAQAMARMTWNEATATAHENGSEVINAELYANGLGAKFASPFSYGASSKADNEYEYTKPDGTVVYIPNSMKGFQAACAESEDAYKTTVKVLVTDGKLRIGVRETTRPSSAGDWAIWDNFQATYIGDDQAAIDQVSGPVIEQATALYDSKMSADSLQALKAAVEAVQTAGSAATINALSAAIEAAKTSIAAYEPFGTAIDNAQARYDAYEAEVKTSDEAKAIFNAAKATAEGQYNNGTVADADVTAAIQALNAGVTQYVINDAVKTATKDKPADISKVIVNNDFATMDKTGWDVKDGNFGFQASNKVEAGEFYNCSFNLQQEIVGLPAGIYYLKARAFYRNGNNATAYVDEDETTKKYETNESAFAYFSTSADVTSEVTGEDGKKSTVINEDVAKAALAPIASATVATVNFNEYLSLGNQDGCVKYVENEDDENLNLWIPNNMVTAQAFFKSEQVGEAFDTKPIEIKYDGKGNFFIGAVKVDKISNDWTIIKNFTLQYAGKDSSTGINQITDKATGNVIGTRIFNAAGVQTGKLQKGINIVETTLSDGSKKVSKIIVK